MSKSTLNRYAAAAAVAATLVAAPSVSLAGAYYYSYFLIDNLTVEAEYNCTTGSTCTGPTGWARPASYNLPQSGASFTADTFAQLIGGTIDTGSDSRKFDVHIPPAGTFPVDAPQAFVNVAGAVEPANNTFDPMGQAAGEYSRSDAIWNQLGAQTNSNFGNLESAGEQSIVMSEGYIDSAGRIDSNSLTTFRGQLDLADLTLDSGAVGVLSWTGNIRLSFDYTSLLVLDTDVPGEEAIAGYNFAFTAREIDSLGNIIVGGKRASFSGTPDTDFNDNLTVQAGQFYNLAYAANTGSVSEVYDLSGGGSLLAFQLDINHKSNGAGESISVPEPGTLALLGLGMLGIGANIRRSKAA